MDKTQEKTPLASELPENNTSTLPETEPVVIDLTASKDYSHLPIGTQASIELDKKLNSSNLPTNLPAPNNIVKDGVLKNDLSKRFFKIALAIFGVFIMCFVIFIGLSLTNIDTRFIKITLNGKVSDLNTGNPVKDASIIINNQEVTRTNQQGEYSIPNLDYGDTSVTIKADGYDDLTENVKVTKVLLDYSTRKDFSLKSSITGVLTGKFVSNISNYDYVNDKLLIGEKEYKISSDGSFNIPNVKVGSTTFTFNSVNFKDISNEIEVIPGINNIPDFSLTPAGDVVGELKSYIREDLVLNTKFFVENILQDQVNIFEDGRFTLKDLDTEKRYKIRVTADGYKTRDYEINIKQGENQLFNFKLVEEGIAIFPSRIGNAVKLFKSDFDGSNSGQLNENTRVDLNSRFYSIEEKVLYYLSNKDSNFTQENGGRVLNIPYKIDINSGIEERLTVNTSNLTELYPNFVSKKMLNVHKRLANQRKEGIELMNLDGTNRINVVLLENSSEEILESDVSNNGKFVVYTFTNNNQHNLSLYNVDNGETKQLLNSKEIDYFDISEDGNLVLASRINPSTNLKDLVLLNFQTNDLRTLKENIKGKDFQFQKGSNNKVLFFEKRESRSNIYVFTIDRSQEDRLTSLTPDYDILDIYQESNLLFYLTNRGLLVADVNKPKNFKIVSQEVYNYTE